MRRRRRSISPLAAVALIAIAAGTLAVRPRLFGVGPEAVHEPSVLAPTITVCGRQYRGGSPWRSLEAIRREDGLPPVLVDPAPLAPCPGPDAHGLRPCTRDPDDAPCATVVHVRVGEDTYAEYELVGGP